MTHQLKCWFKFFQAIKRGEKTFECRKDDRNYQVGDVLDLREYHPSFTNLSGAYTGESLSVRVTHIMRGGFGVVGDYCVMSIQQELSEDAAILLSRGLDLKPSDMHAWKSDVRKFLLNPDKCQPALLEIQRENEKLKAQIVSITEGSFGASQALAADMAALRASIPALVEAAWREGFKNRVIYGGNPDRWWPHSTVSKKLKEMKL